MGRGNEWEVGDSFHPRKVERAPSGSGPKELLEGDNDPRGQGTSRDVESSVACVEGLVEGKTRAGAVLGTRESPGGRKALGPKGLSEEVTALARGQGRPSVPRTSRLSRRTVESDVEEEEVPRKVRKARRVWDERG